MDRTQRFAPPPGGVLFSALACSALAAGCLVGTRTASAQTPSPLAEWQYSSGVQLQQLFAPTQAAWKFAIGPAVSFQPLYPGALHYHTIAGASLDIRYRDLFFLSTGEGLGVNLLHGRNWRAGMAITYDLGRRTADAPELYGLNNIGAAPEIKLFGEYVMSKAFPLVVRADVRRSVGGSNGWIADLGAYMPLPGSSETFYWFAGPTVTFADRRYMDSWFGIGAAQSLRSGYSAYRTHAGLRSYGFGLNAIWNFRPHWFLNVDAAIQQLTGTAAHSPVTQRATNGVVDLSVVYAF